MQVLIKFMHAFMHVISSISPAIQSISTKFPSSLHNLYRQSISCCIYVTGFMETDPNRTLEVTS